VDLTPEAPPEHQAPWTTLRQVPVNLIPTAPSVVLSPVSYKDNPTEAQDRVNRNNIKEYDRGGDRMPYYWPPFRKGPPTIFLLIIDVDAPRQVQDQKDVTMTINDNIGDGSAPDARHMSRCALEEVQDPSDVHNAMFSYYTLFSMRREIDDLMEVIDDDFTFAREEGSSGKTRSADHVLCLQESMLCVRQLWAVLA
jgi:hypothetical protein